MEPPSASAALLRDLGARGLLTPAQVGALERLLRARLAWLPWGERLLLALGAALLLAGVIFFFAYNWDKMPAWQKLGVVEAGIALAAIAAIAAAWRGLDDFAGKIALSSACVLTGVFLAVFGQIYQTGADTFQLFVGWAALIFPWVLLGRFPALWIFWLALVNVAIGLSWDRVNWWRALGLRDFSDVAALLGAINGIALAAREIAVARGRAWLDERWLRPLLVIATFGALTVANVALILEAHVQAWSIVPPALLLVAIALGYHTFRYWRPSLSSLAVMTLSVCTVVVAALGRIVVEQKSDAGSLLFFAVIVLVIFGGAVAWLRSVAATLRTS